MRVAKILSGITAAFASLAATGVALAQDGLDGLERVGKPVSEAYGFQPAATELARDIHFLDSMILWIITAICLFVTALLLIIVVRFNKRANPTPATFTHHSALEVAWTIIPIVILIFIGAFSLPVLFKQMEIPEAGLTIKVTGNQWYWTYDYVDEEFGFDSVMLTKDELADYGYMADEYLLATDTSVVVPVNTNVVMQITGSDVIHAWAIPAFGVKMDAVPGRLAEIWFNAEKEGLYFGQCSELCGLNHTYMPITVKVVSQEVYDEWLKGAIEEFASVDTPELVQIASN